MELLCYKILLQTRRIYPLSPRAIPLSCAINSGHRSLSSILAAANVAAVTTPIELITMYPRKP